VRGLPYVKAAAVYMLRDVGSDAPSGFGLLEEDFTPRPSMAAFAGAMVQ
jgi:hypothetical protein